MKDQEMSDIQILLENQQSIKSDINMLREALRNVIVHLETILKQLDTVTQKSAEWANGVSLTAQPKPNSLGSLTKAISHESYSIGNRG